MSIRRAFSFSLCLAALVATASVAGCSGGTGGGPSCGDGACAADESCTSCPADCGACQPCGDTTCEPGETCSTCPADCGACPPPCGNGECDPGETCSTCGADCGACPPPCGNGVCDPGETCSTCEDDCGACGPRCGDGTCDPGETCNNCAVDCGGAACCIGAGSLPTAPAATIAVQATCSAPAACAGTVEGSWQYASACLPPSTLFDQVYAICSASTLSGSVTGTSFRGYATFANGVFARRYSATGQATFRLPNYCHGCRCDDMESMLRSTGYDASCGTVCDSGWCTCTVRASVAVNESSTYTVSGSRITTSDGRSFDFCTDASGLALKETTSLSTGVYQLAPWAAGPFPEVCDGVDNDASGQVDDAPRDCPPSCDTSGVCATGTTAVCNGESGWACSYTAPAYQAVESVCDRLDNDCDGSVDEPAQCGPEICDGVDNDGNGTPDDALTDTPACSAQGVCAAGGAPRCDGAAGWTCLYGTPSYEPVETTCDALDNDCDGAVDEALVGALAANQAGVCQGSTRVCAGGEWSEPDYALVPGHEEVETLCDGEDNDCDGAVDESLTGPLADRQLGVCAGARKVCDGAAGWIEPSYAPIPGWAADETASCDGLDNDCDGTVDEGQDQDGDGYFTAANAECVATYGPLGKVDCDDAVPGLNASCVLHVDAAATGTGDGWTWVDAFPSLADALAAAKDGYELWVARGTYSPDEGAGLTPGDRTVSFAVARRVSVYGGFAGTETIRDERNLGANETILSGDLLGDDGPSFANRTDNSYLVVKVTAAATLDGLTVRGGENPSSDPWGFPGGGASFSSGGTLARSRIVDNRAGNGGGVVVTGGALAIGESLFDGNAARASGGGIEVRGGTVTVATTDFQANQAGNSGGGALYVSTGSAALTDDVFAGNVASGRGGAINGANLTVDGCTFTGNRADYGGAAVIGGPSTVTDSTFTGNSAQTGGGAVYATGGTFVRCVFTGNGCGLYGGAVQTYNGAPTFAGCVFDGNSSSNVYGTPAYGGAISAGGVGAPVAINSTFSGNAADDTGGALFVGTGTMTVRNAVFFDNTRNALDVSSGTLDVSHSCTQGSFAGTGNIAITRSPFVDIDGPDNLPGTPDDDLRLAAGSECIDSGDNAAVPAYLTTDLDGHDRIVNATVDRGAYERL